jgi:hypothetical protein
MEAYILAYWFFNDQTSRPMGEENPVATQSNRAATKMRIDYVYFFKSRMDSQLPISEDHFYPVEFP